MQVQSRGPAEGNWVELTASTAPAGPGGMRQGWMMVDGAEVGLGPLLQRVVQLPPPRVVFAGARALVVSWDAGPENLPVKLQIHHGEKGSGLALCPSTGAVGTEAVANHRVGGLQPDTQVSLRLVAAHVEAVSDDDTNGVASEWIVTRTRPSASTHDRPMSRRVTRDDGTSCNASPDAFGRLRGQVLTSTAARLDCPIGLWMPSELLHGGLNAAVANFRCGDCCLSPAQHEDFGPAQEQPKQLPTRRQQPLAMEPEPEPQPPTLSRDEYLEAFCTWDSSRPSWTHLYTEQSSSTCGDAEDTGVMAVIATSDIHIDFPDNQRCKHDHK